MVAAVGFDGAFPVVDCQQVNVHVLGFGGGKHAGGFAPRPAKQINRLESLLTHVRSSGLMGFRPTVLKTSASVVIWMVRPVARCVKPGP